jgi:hypothetical protein
MKKAPGVTRGAADVFASILNESSAEARPLFT